MNLRRFGPVALIGLGAALVAIAVIQRTDITDFGERAEGVSYDERVRYTTRPETARSDIVVTLVSVEGAVLAEARTTLAAAAAASPGRVCLTR